MTPLAGIDRWRRWSVTALGALLFGVIIGTIAVVHPELTTLDLLQEPVPILLALGLTGYGAWLARSGLPTERITRIALWCLAGTVVIGSFAMWEMSLELAKGNSLAEMVHVLLRGGTEGALVGGLVGYYDARRQEQHQETERANRAITASIDGIAVLDEDGRYTEVNQAHADVYGYEGPEDFIDESWRMCYTDPDSEVIEEEVFADLQETGYWRGELTGKRRDGSTFPQALTLTVTDDGGMVCIVRDISERKAHEQELEQYEAIVRAMPDEVYMIDADGYITFLNVDNAKTGYTSDELIGEHVSTVIDEDDIAKGKEVIRELRTNDECKTVTFEMGLITRDGDRIPHENHTALLPYDDGGFRGTVGVLRDITERKRREQQLHTLHEATRDMMAAATRQEVADVACEAGDDILDVPVNIHLYDEDADGLAPVAISPKTQAVLGTPPTIREGEGIAWRIYESGDPESYADVRTAPGALNTETPIRSECCLPLDDHGVLLAASTTVDAFDDSDISLLKILAATVETAFDRARREQELNRQLDRMEFFNSILRHDVLNGMTVIQGRAEFLTDEVDGDQLRDAETILDWSNDVIEIVQRVQTTLDTLIGENDVQLEPVGLSETLQQEVDRVRKTYPEVAFEAAIPDAVHVQANDLVGDVFGNIITNAVDHNETDGLCVSITATEQADANTTIVRIADNGTGIPDEATEAIFRRENTGHAKSSGSGFGLFFVDAMVEKYGGDIWVEDNDAGGATFVIELPLADAITLT